MLHGATVVADCQACGEAVHVDLPTDPPPNAIVQVEHLSDGTHRWLSWATA